MPQLVALNTRDKHEESQEYVDRFYQAEFTPYDFMCLYVAVNASQKNFLFNRDHLLNYIKTCKNGNQFNRLLDDIYISSNGVSDYSESLHEAIQTLKMAKILYTISPEVDASMFIFENTPMAELIKNRIDYFDDMVNFVEGYTQYKLSTIGPDDKDITIKPYQNLKRY